MQNGNMSKKVDARIGIDVSFLRKNAFSIVIAVCIEHESISTNRRKSPSSKASEPQPYQPAGLVRLQTIPSC